MLFGAHKPLRICRKGFLLFVKLPPCCFDLMEIEYYIYGNISISKYTMYFRSCLLFVSIDGNICVWYTKSNNLSVTIW